MNVKDIPQEMLSKIRDRFESTPDVVKLRTKQQYEQRIGNFSEALKIAKQLEELFTQALYHYMEKTEKEVMTIDTEAANLPEKDREEMMEKIMVLFMACDIIESSIIDLNDVLHRTNPDIDITTFNDIQQLSDMAKQKLKYLQENGDYMKDLIWADKCDNMYEIMQSEAKSIIRKRKESKNWGDNMKKLENV